MHTVEPNDQHKDIGCHGCHRLMREVRALEGENAKLRAELAKCRARKHVPGDRSVTDS